MNRPTPFLTTPIAILLGSVIISIAILMHGGVIKIASKTAGTEVAAPTASADTGQAQKPAVTLAQIKDVFNKSAIKFGDTSKKLVAIEVADPSCPYCQIAAGKNGELNKSASDQFTLVADGGSYIAPVPELRKLVENGQAAFAWIYTPGHGNGEMGTKALYCANEQGKFWDVHDMLMSAKGYDILNDTVKNDKTKSQDMANFLQPVFDPATMKQCLDSGKYDDRLATDASLAQSIGVTGTPGFYLNTTLFAGAYNYKDMEGAAKSALGI